ISVAFLGFGAVMNYVGAGQRARLNYPLALVEVPLLVGGIRNQRRFRLPERVHAALFAVVGRVRGRAVEGAGDQEGGDQSRQGQKSDQGEAALSARGCCSVRWSAHHGARLLRSVGVTTAPLPIGSLTSPR